VPSSLGGDTSAPRCALDGSVGESSGLRSPSSTLGSPLSSRDCPSSSRQLPSSGRQLPSSSRQLPSSSRRLPSSSRQLSSSSRQLPSWSRHFPSSSRRHPSSSRHLLSSSRHLASSSRHPATLGRQLATLGPRDVGWDGTSRRRASAVRHSARAGSRPERTVSRTEHSARCPCRLFSRGKDVTEMWPRGWPRYRRNESPGVALRLRLPTATTHALDVTAWLAASGGQPAHRLAEVIDALIAYAVEEGKGEAGDGDVSQVPMIGAAGERCSPFLRSFR